MKEIAKKQAKKLFIFSELLPYPLTGGGSIAQYFFIENLISDFEITYSTIISTAEQKQAVQKLQAALPGLKLCIFEEKLRAKWKTKIINFILNIKNWAEKITKRFLADDANQNSDSRLSKTRIKYYSPIFIEFLEKKFDEEKFDFIQLEFFESISLLSILPKDSIKIFVHHELRFKLLFNSGTDTSGYTQYLMETAKGIELSLLNNADKVVVFNEDDKQLLTGIKAEVLVSPFGIPKQLIRKTQESKYYDNFIFMGGSAHFPNKEGLEWFLEQIYIPLYDSIDLPLNIIGNWDKSIRLKYRKYKKIAFKGFVPEIGKYFENSVMICPILSGSGIRTKIIEAFANKIPVLSTRLGSEGLFDESSETNHLLHFDSKEEFIQILEMTKANTEILSKIAVNGFNYYQNTLNPNHLIEVRKSIYQ